MLGEPLAPFVLFIHSRFGVIPNWTPTLKNNAKGTHLSLELDARDPWPCVTLLTSRE